MYLPHEDDEDDEEMEEDFMLRHFKCYEFRDLKAEFESAIEKGNKRFCPGCNIGGIKNDDCTHMTCDNCNTRYCYLCGKSEANCDTKYCKEDPKGTIYSHNKDWSSNELRCPMYLTEIGEVDNRWPEDNDQACRELFHRLLTYTQIREFILKHGMDKYDELCDVFPCVKNHGYDLEEAMDTDLTIINRDD